MTDELKQLIEDAAKLLGLEVTGYAEDLGAQYVAGSEESPYTDYFNPLDPDRGDLMKVAEAAEIFVNWKACWVTGQVGPSYDFTKGDYQSLALAILRAASAVWKAREGVKK